MNVPTTHDEELYLLLGDWCNGTITPERLARLEHLLRSDPAARQFYWNYMSLRSELSWRESASAALARRSPPPDLLADLASPPPARSPVMGFLSRALHGDGHSPVAHALILIAMIVGSGVALLGILLISRGVHVDERQSEIANHESEIPAPTSQTPIPNAAPIARLARTANCRWADNSDAPRVGDDLMPGRKLVLEEGLVEIIFQSGAQSVLQGPATLEIGSRTAACLQRGKLAVTVENPLARGFEVHTPGMKFTDLGTEFGVLLAQDGAQEVHVFRGRVQAEAAVDSRKNSHSSSTDHQPPTANHASPFLLTAGQAVRIASPGKPAERIAADEKQFVRTEQMTARVTAAEEKVFPPANVVWKEIGEAPSVVGMAVVGGKLFACTADNKLQVCDPAAAAVRWKTIGNAPGPVVAMGMAEGKLCVSLNARAGRRFLKRDAVETSADWQEEGHAWCLVGMAAASGKIYAIVDTKEAGTEPTIMAREAVATPELLAKMPPAARGLDGLPWTAARVDRRPPVGSLAMTAVGGKFYVATNENKLFVGDPTNPDVEWQEIGDVAGVSVLAGGDGKLFAATKSGKLLMWEPKISK